MNNRKNILLTFVLPCYNMEKYVQQCLDSIYECDLQENQFEVLCINDCSPDHTQQILETNQRKHSNLRIVAHEENRGLGGARNTGIRESLGKYMWFVDPDDVITAPRLYELLQRVDEQGVDLFCFNYREIDLRGNVNSEKLFFKDTEVTDGFSFAESVFGHGSLVYFMYCCWRYIYRTEYIRDMGLRFPEKVAFEEPAFMSRAVLNAQRIISFSDVMYSYRLNPDGITQTFYNNFPAKLIYDKSFAFALSLLHLSDEIKDEAIKKTCREFAISHTILNSFGFNLLRTSKAKRKEFYQLITEKREEIVCVKGYLSSFNRILLLPVVGSHIADFCAALYKWKHCNGKRE